MDVAEKHLPQWELDLDDTGYEQEIREYWKKDAPKESKRVDDLIKKDDRKAKDKAQKKAAEAAKKKEEEEKKAEEAQKVVKGKEEASKEKVMGLPQGSGKS